MWLHSNLLTIILFFISTTSAVITYQTLTSGTLKTVTVNPCQIVYFRWSFTSPASLFSVYAKANTSQPGSDLVNIYITPNEPSDTEVGGIDCDIDSCTGVGTTGCEINTCLTTNTTWYVWVSHFLSVPLDIEVVVNAVALPTSVALPVNTTLTSASGRNNRYNFFDYWVLDIKPNDNTYSLGTSISIQAKSTNDSYPDPHLMVDEGTIPPFGECSVINPPVGQLELLPCTVIAGGKFQITVVRSLDVQEYTLIAEPKSPRIVQIGTDKDTFFTANSDTETVYFQFVAPPGGRDRNIEIIIDNIYGGIVYAQYSYQKLPFESACTWKDDCGSINIGCQALFDSCSVDTSSTGPYYLYTNVAFNSPSDPVTFTVRAVITPFSAPEVNLGSNQYGSVKKRDHARYHLSRGSVPPGAWLNVGVFLDNTLNTEPSPEAVLNVYSGNNVLCNSINYPFSCNLVDDARSVKSCSLQFDSCMLDSLGSDIYIEIFAYDASQYYYFQEETSYVLWTEIMDPEANTISVGEIRSSVVDNRQYRIFKVINLPSDAGVSLTLSSNPRTSPYPTLNAWVFYKDSIAGPSCGCFSPDMTFGPANTDNPVSSNDITSCDFYGHSHFYVAVWWSATTNAFNLYYQNEFVLSVDSAPALSNLIRNPISLSVGQTIQRNIATNEGTDYYDLQFDAKSLKTNSYKIVLISHDNLYNVYAQRYLNDFTYFACNGGGEYFYPQTVPTTHEMVIHIDPCSVDNSNNDHMLVTVTGPSSLDTLSQGVYSISFQSVDTSAQEISGFPFETVMDITTGYYKHFKVVVPDSAIANGHQLTIEAYIDASFNEFVSVGTLLNFYFNTPAQSERAGDPDDCFCNQQSLSDSTKIEIVVDECSLTAGDYYFSLLTNAPAYANINVPIHIKVNLPGTDTLGAFPGFNTAQDYSLLASQTAIIPFPLDSTFFDPTNVDKTILVRVFTTTLDDQVSIYASSYDPNQCSCQIPEFYPSLSTTPDEKNVAEINLDYCLVTQTPNLYLSITPSRESSLKGPIPFTVEFIRNQNPPITDIKFTGTPPCGGSAIVFESVAHHSYRFYNFVLPSNLKGNEKIDVTITNVTEGSAVELYLQDASGLPTAGCNRVGVSPGVNSISEDCSSKAKYLSVYGIADEMDEPVSYLMKVCINTVVEFDFNSDSSKGGDLDPLTTDSYNTQFDQLQQTDIALFSLSLTTFFPSTLTISQSSCSSCAVASLSVTCVTSPCYLIIPLCNLPENYRDTPWIIDVHNADPTNTILYQLTSKIIQAPSPSVFTNNQNTQLTINGGGALTLFQWIPTPSTSGLISQSSIKGVNAPGVLLYKSNLLSNLLCSPYTGALPDIPVSSCSLSNTPIYIMFLNLGPSPVTPAPTINTNVTLETSVKIMTTTETSTSITLVGDTKLTIPPISYPAVYPQIRIPFPGTSAVGYSDIVIYQDTAVPPTPGTLTSSINLNYPASRISPSTACYVGSAPLSFATPFQRYNCPAVANPFFNFYNPVDIVIGYNNYDTIEASTTLSMAIRKPVLVTSLISNQQLSGVSRELGVITQYDLSNTLIPLPNRYLQINVTTTIESYTVSINQKGYAGGTPCSPVADVYSNVATPTTDFQSPPFHLCPLDPETNYYLSVVPTTKVTTTVGATSDFKITISIVDPGTKETTINPDTTSSPIDPDVAGNNLLLTTNPSSPSTGSLQYLQVTPNLKNPLSASLSYSVEWDCTTYSESYRCALNNTKCTGLVFPCLYSPSTRYFFDLIEAETEQFTVTTVTKTANIVDVTFPEDPDTTTEISGTVFAHELAVYKLTIDGEKLLPSESISISLGPTSCGTVEVYINQDFSAGRGCTLDGSNVCSSGSTVDGCPVLLTLQPCQEISKELLGDYYIVVRGLDQFNFAQGNNLPARFTIYVTRTGHLEEHIITANEIATIVADLVEADPTPCPLSVAPGIENCAACGTVATTQKYAVKPAYWIIPLNGGQYITDQTLNFGISDTNAISQITFSLFKHKPDFCVNTPVASCTADPDPCSLTIPTCTYNDFNELYIGITVVYTGGAAAKSFTRTSNAKSLPVATIMLSTPTPQYVLDVSASDKPQYLLFTLAPQESQFIRVLHDTNRDNIADYYFKAGLYSLGVNGQRFNLYQGWDTCAATNPVYAFRNTRCANFVSDSSCLGTTATSCNCQITKGVCQLTDQDFTYLRIQNAAPSTMVGKMEFTFRMPRIPLPPACDDLSANQIKHFINVLTPSIEQIWYFELYDKSNTGSIILRVSDLSLTDPTIPCNAAQTITLSGNLDYQYMYFRRLQNSDPWISVQELSGTPQKYQIKESLYDTNPKDLAHNTWTATAYQEVDETTGCIIDTETNWWRYKTTGKSAILVEIQSTVAGSAYINRNYVTYLYGGVGVLSTGSATYNKLLIDNNINNQKWVGTYYIHVPVASVSTSIRITEFDPNVVSLSLAQRTLVSKIDDYLPLSYQTSQINPDLDPSEHLYLSITSYDGVDVWVTRGRFSDKTKDVSRVIDPSPEVTGVSPVSSAVPHCRLLETSDSYFVNFMRNTQTVNSVVADLPVLIRADLETRSVTKSNSIVKQTGPIPAYSTRRTTYTIPTALGTDDIIYIKFEDIDFGLLAADEGAVIQKGPVVTSAVDTTRVDTDADQSCPICASFDLEEEAAWLDSCWHCSSIDTVYVDVTVSDAYLQRSAVDYTLKQTVASWKDITGSSSSFDLEGEFLSYDFFTATLPSDAGAKILVQVTSGALVTVQIMPADCSKRSDLTTTTIECLNGFKCEVYSTKSNIVGLSGEYRIVIKGEEAEGTVTVQTGDGLCTGVSGDNAPFCSGVISGTVVGEPESISQKDAYAQYLYNQLVPAFNAEYSAPGGCGSASIPESTRSALKTYACQTAMPVCNNGFGKTPDYTVCKDIVDSSGVTFAAVGHPELGCNKNFYNGGVTWVGPGDDVTPSNPTTNSETSSEPNLLLALLIIPIIVIIIIVVLIVYFIVAKGGEAAAAGGQYTQQ